jgi:hypothetical protein
VRSLAACQLQAAEEVFACSRATFHALAVEQMLAARAVARRRELPGRVEGVLNAVVMPWKTPLGWSRANAGVRATIGSHRTRPSARRAHPVSVSLFRSDACMREASGVPRIDPGQGDGPNALMAAGLWAPRRQRTAKTPQPRS